MLKKKSYFSVDTNESLWGAGSPFDPLDPLGKALFISSIISAPLEIS